MAYHEAYWVAVATAAPVIALANTVTITDTSKVWFGAKVQSDFTSGLYRLIVVLSGLNLLVQVWALAAEL